MKQQQTATPPKPNTNITPVILAGGQGLRLRPLTSPKRPKALTKFFAQDSFLQRTIKRVPSLNPPIIITEEQHTTAILEQLQTLNIPKPRIIAEPANRSTAPAIALAALIAENENLLILPCDQAIKHQDQFEHLIITAATIPLQDKFLLFGVKPKHPATRYGYIESTTGGIVIDKVKSFHEKPDRKTVLTYLKQGNYFWNTGIFLTTARHLQNEFHNHQPALIEQAKQAIKEHDGSLIKLHKTIYEKIPPISIDTAIMEKTQTAYITPLGLPWCDTGTWPSLLASKFGIF